MTEETDPGSARTYEADDPANPNNLVVRGSDGDPLPHPTGTRMIERESYERVVEGLKMAADACQHIAKGETVQASIWIDIGATLDRMRLEAVALAGLDLVMKQNETAAMRGEAMSWRKSRQQFLDGIKQATGGMRQLATCFRGDFNWSFMAQQLERYEKSFRELMLGAPRELLPRPRGLILPPGFERH